MPFKRKDSPYWWAWRKYPDGRRQRESTGTISRAEAEAIEAKWKVEAHRAKHWGEQPSYAYEDMMDAYLEATKDSKRSAWRDEYSATHLGEFFSGRVLNDLKRSDVRGYIDFRKAKGALLPKRKAETERRSRQVSPSTINRELDLLSAAINYARVEWEWDIPNPTLGISLPEPEGRLRYLSKEEYAALLNSARASKKAPHLADFIRLAVHTGMREQEMLGMAVERIDLRQKLLKLEGKDTKGKRRRYVPMNEQARQAVLNRLRFRAEHCPDSPWLFCHKDGERIQSVQTSFERARDVAGIQGFRIHDLRHTCASWLVMEGVSLYFVKALLGHSSIETTERYAHLAPENVRQAVSVLDGLSRIGHVAGDSNASVAA
ncbi:MAG: tyrosine-type recombinase/integrase [Betaproteobacteria bacterium]